MIFEIIICAEILIMGLLIIGTIGQSTKVNTAIYGEILKIRRKLK